MQYNVNIDIWRVQQAVEIWQVTGGSCLLSDTNCMAPESLDQVPVLVCR